MLIRKEMQSGFSLVELLVTIGILAILLAMAMPSYRAWVQNARIRNAAESIQNGLQLAKAEAVRRNASVHFLLGTGSGWTVGCEVVVASCPATIQSRSTAEGSSASIIVTPTPATGTTVVFNNIGSVVASGAVTFTQLDLDVDPSVLPAAQSHELRITVGGGGKIRMCAPGIASPDPRAC